jgi:hypothetical protein
VELNGSVVLRRYLKNLRREKPYARGSSIAPSGKFRRGREDYYTENNDRPPEMDALDIVTIQRMLAHYLIPIG